jgi:hypothetical protein
MVTDPATPSSFAALRCWWRALSRSSSVIEGPIVLLMPALVRLSTAGAPDGGRWSPQDDPHSRSGGPLSSAAPGGFRTTERPR